MSLFKSVGSAFAVCAIGMLAGCGPESNVGEIHGTVSVDGKPAGNGAIAFTPANGQGPSGGGELVDGKYKCDASLGDCKVEIRIPKVTGTKKLYDTPDSPTQQTFAETLPLRYNEATELRVNIQKGKNEKNWELDSK